MVGLCVEIFIPFFCCYIQLTQNSMAHGCYSFVGLQRRWSV